MQRYYGQPYARLDDPATAASSIGLHPFGAGDRRTVEGGAASYQPPPYPPQPHTAVLQPEESSYEPYRQNPSLRPPTDNFVNRQSYEFPDELPPHPAKRVRFQRLHRPVKAWSSKKNLTVFGAVAAAVVIIVAIAAGVAVGLTHDTFSYTPSIARVTNISAFYSGGATNRNPQNTSDGIGAGSDTYQYFTGPASNFPNQTAWVSFENMWTNNLETLQTSCENLKEGPNNTPQIIQSIYDAIQNRAAASAVDHRFIFAVILQESKGCVHVQSTVSSGGTKNPGLMQSHQGDSYSASHSNASIFAMVQDGTQGTSAGDGLVQNLNIYGNPYSAARGYNSGYIPKSGDLSDAAGATACYVSDIANRLTGWVWANSTCPGDDS